MCRTRDIIRTMNNEQTETDRFRCALTRLRSWQRAFLWVVLSKIPAHLVWPDHLQRCFPGCLGTNVVPHASCENQNDQYSNYSIAICPGCFRYTWMDQRISKFHATRGQRRKMANKTSSEISYCPRGRCVGLLLEDPSFPFSRTTCPV